MFLAYLVTQSEAFDWYQRHGKGVDNLTLSCIISPLFVQKGLIVLENEKKLVEEAKRDPQAFAALYDQYFDQIYRYVYRRVSQKEAADDLVSQTFYDALSHIQSYEWRGFPFSSWLYKIAHNNVLKWYRKNGRTQTVHLEDNYEFSDGNTEGQIERLEKEELRHEMEGILAQLELQDREIIRLKFFEEVSNVEIAQIMGLSANHIGVKVFRALKKVKQLLP